MSPMCPEIGVEFAPWRVVCDLRRGTFSGSSGPVDWPGTSVYRLADARQVQKKLGPAWTGRGRPPAGYFTTRLAEDWLRGLLEEARRGTLPGMVRTGATFADAAAEYLRYIEHDRGRKPSTVRGYRSDPREYRLDPRRLGAASYQSTPSALIAQRQPGARWPRRSGPRLPSGLDARALLGIGVANVLGVHLACLKPGVRG
jgi:hypothetical protein